MFCYFYTSTGIAVKTLRIVEGYAAEHNTQKYKIPADEKVILRRGNSIKFKMILKRPFIETDRDFEIILSTGARPRESTGTMGVARDHTPEEYQDKVKHGKWAFEILEVKTILSFCSLLFFFNLARINSPSLHTTTFRFGHVSTSIRRCSDVMY